MKKIKYSVQGIILNNKGQVLGVSRKTDHNDFGLVGGKVDPTDKSLLDALKRETKEETGLDVNTDTCILVFVIHKDGFMGYTYYIPDWSGEINHNEPHVVNWTSFQTLKNGSFGRYNSLVAESLDDMGITYQKYDDKSSDYYALVISDDTDDNPYIIFDFDESAEEDYLSMRQIDEVGKTLMNHGYYLSILDEASYQIYIDDDSLIKDPLKLVEILKKCGFKYSKKLAKMYKDDKLNRKIFAPSK